MTQPLRLPHIDTDRCTGCGWCVAACPPGLLSLEVEQQRKRSVLHGAERCTGCALCAVKCPFQVIRMRRMPQHSVPPVDGGCGPVPMQATGQGCP